jgi:hypothetical protein
MKKTGWYLLIIIVVGWVNSVQAHHPIQETQVGHA